MSDDPYWRHAKLVKQKKKIVQGLSNKKNVTLSTDDALACGGGGVASVDARRGPPKGTPPPLDLPVAVINS